MCVAFSIISVAILTILVAKGDLPLLKADAKLDKEVIARVIWVSGMVAALGASFYCLRRLAARFGEGALATENGITLTDTSDGVIDGEVEEASAFDVSLQDEKEGVREDDENRMEGARPNREEFIVAYFWSGLWFRIAQAEVYTIVLFLAIWGGSLSSETGQGGAALLLGLPLLALVVGLFVRAAEELIAGIAERLFAVVRALLPRG